MLLVFICLQTVAWFFRRFRVRVSSRLAGTDGERMFANLCGMTQGMLNRLLKNLLMPQRCSLSVVGAETMREDSARWTQAGVASISRNSRPRANTRALCTPARACLGVPHSHCLRSNRLKGTSKNPVFAHLVCSETMEDCYRQRWVG